MANSIYTLTIDRKRVTAIDMDSRPLPVFIETELTRWRSRLTKIETNEKTVYEINPRT